MSEAYTEQDLREAKSFVVGAGGVEICLCSDESCRPKFEASLAAEFTRIRSEARAGMREACAKHWPHPRWKECACGHKMSGKNFGLQWAQHVRNLPVSDADAALSDLRDAAMETALLLACKSIIESLDGGEFSSASPLTKVTAAIEKVKAAARLEGREGMLALIPSRDNKRLRTLCVMKDGIYYPLEVIPSRLADDIEKRIAALTAAAKETP